MDAKDITMFQELIGEMRWSIKIGRVDIFYEVSVLSAFQASYLEGNLHKVFNIFSFIKKNLNLTIYFDLRFPNINPMSFSGS